MSELSTTKVQVRIEPQYDARGGYPAVPPESRDRAPYLIPQTHNGQSRSVWSTDSVDGSLVVALLSEAAIGMPRYCTDGESVTMTDEDGDEYEHTTKPSTESIVNV